MNALAYIVALVAACVFTIATASDAETITSKAFFKLGGTVGPPRTVVIGLFGETVPNTVENFKALVTGEKGTGKIYGLPLHYKGSYVNRVFPGSYVMLGDISHSVGMGGEAALGDGILEDENFILEHKAFYVSMANAGEPNTAGSQFFVTLRDMPELNGKNVVFGKVLEGQEVFNSVLGNAQTGTPSDPMKILDCGIVA